jgi:peptidyl-prolyl cis-trans isomerase SurA
MRFNEFSTTLLTLPVIAAALLAPCSTVRAQAPDSTRVAGIVAVVGDSVITSAYVLDATNRRMQELQQAGRPVPTTAEAVKAMQDELIDERVEELVILQAIARDTTYKVSEDNVGTVVDQRFNEMQAQQGGPIVFAERLRNSGMDVQQYRNLLAAQVRTEELFRQFRQRMSEKRQAPKASEKEIEDLFPAWQESRGPRPAMVSFQQVVVPVTASDTAARRAHAKADSIYQQLLKDRDLFGDLARRFSDDPGTREKGGEFGWFSESEVAREFGRAAFSAPVGALLPPVKTQFGYHVIEVQRRRGGQVQARHILISPTITADDFKRAMARADSAAAQLRAGADPESVIQQYGDPTQDLSITGANPADIAAAIGLDLTDAKVGDVVGPTASPEGPGRQITIARVTSTSPAGQWALNDPGVRDNIRSIIETQKLLDEVVEELKRETYIDIRAH